MIVNDHSQDVQALIAREEAFYAAQTASDVDRLADIMSDELKFFGHTTGVVDDKASYLEAVASGRYAHGPITRVHGQTRVSGDGAVSIGVIDMVARPPGQQQFSMRLQQVLFWIHEPAGWRLTVRQATRMPL